MKIPVAVNGNKEEVSDFALALRQQMIKAAKGDNASARIIMNALSKFIGPLMQEHREKMLQAENSDGGKPTYLP